MLGRNHAVYAAAVWVGAYPMLTEAYGLAAAQNPGALGATTLIAAGAGVIPDLDHPDSRPARHFGFLSRLAAKAVNAASGGHRVGTHSLAFAALLAGLAMSVQVWPAPYGRWAAAVACGLCATVGLQLVGPSLGFRVPWLFTVGAGAGIGWAVWDQFVIWDVLLPWLAAGGVIVHCLCDAVTKGGVPFLFPLTRRRFALGLFRVGGPGESAAAALGMLGLAAAVFWSLRELT